MNVDDQTAPHQAERTHLFAEPEPVPSPYVFVHNPARPIAAMGLVAVLIGVFILQLSSQIFVGADGPSMFDINAMDLQAQGGIIRDKVTEGQWFRLLTGPLMHVSWLHLLMNSVALFIAGSALETMVGRAWFLVLFFVTAWCGAAGSLMFNPDDIVSVGASGGALGLFGGAVPLVILRIKDKESRNRLVMQLLQVLIPSLLSVGTATLRADVAAHVFGAVSGAAFSIVLLALWRPDGRPIHGRRFAAVLAASCALVSGACLWKAAQQRDGWSEQAEAYQAAQPWLERVVPNERMTELDTNFDAIAQEFPDDPRVLLRRSGRALDEGRAAEAEAILEPIAGQYDALDMVFQDGSISRASRLIRGSALERLGRYDEADAEVGTLCETVPPSDMSYTLIEGICATRHFGYRIASRAAGDAMHADPAAFAREFPDDPRNGLQRALQALDNGNIDEGMRLLMPYWEHVDYYDERLPHLSVMLRLGRSYGEMLAGDAAAARESVGTLCVEPSRSSSEVINAHCNWLDSAR